MIHYLPHTVSPGLQRENEVHAPAGTEGILAQIASYFPTADAFLADFLESPEGRTFVGALASLPPASSVLDVGAGRGLTSIYLARQGHRVTFIEPSAALCRYAERASELYRLPLAIYNVTAEGLDSLPVQGFDVCVFNASLHHCDDPDRALANCQKLLRAGGRIFLLNEPHLQRFRSRAWFYQEMARHPRRMGHYGGNEHIYYHHEYLAMLRRAGFRDVRASVSCRYLRPAPYLARLEDCGTRRMDLLSRRLYYRLLRHLNAHPIYGRGCLELLRRLSLLQADFTATTAAQPGALAA